MKSAVLLSLGALALANPVKNVKVPLARRANFVNSDGTANVDLFLASLKQTVLKYNPNFQLPEALQNLDESSIFKRANNEPLADQNVSGEDELYYGSGTIGTTSPQTFTFDFDTGSSDLFVPGPSCGASQGCAGTTKYNQKGQDEGNTTSITYGSGSVAGENYFDSVTIAGLTASHQNVISATTATGFSTSASDGLLGMAFQSIANSGQPPFFFTLINEGKLANKEFSFYLGRIASGTQGNSELTLGGQDSSKYTGAFTSVPVSSQTYWQVAIDGVTVNGASANNFFENTAGQAAIDTGTTVVIAPSAAAAAIYGKIPGSQALLLESFGSGITLYSYPCNSNPNVALTFAGKSFAINPLDFNFGQVSSSSNIFGNLFGGSSGPSCLGGIAGGDLVPGEALYIVGDTFLKNWYSTFSYVSPSSASVNFAKAV